MLVATGSPVVERLLARNGQSEEHAHMTLH